jgi:Rrf2 family cysteine metabolism transcriptional repressor
MKVDYGLRALVYLAQNYGRGACLTADIAADQSVPLPFLKQLLTDLRRSGLVQSRRGRRGGHMLATPPARTPLYDAVTALEGSPVLLDCLTDPKECFLATSCSQRLLWHKVGNSIEEILKTTTLDDLAEEKRRLSEKGSYLI